MPTEARLKLRWRSFAPRDLALLAGLGALSLLLLVIFLTVGLEGSISERLDIAWKFRAGKVSAMLLVAVAIGVSTVLFQTITHNRILTPGVMGLDAMYTTIQACLVFSLGSKGVVDLDPALLFALETSSMVAFSFLLQKFLFERGRSLHILILVGVVFGVLFRSLSSFIYRVIDPNEFAFLQDRLFASFNRPSEALLITSAILVAGICLLLARFTRVYDVIQLGKDMAVGLGVDHKRVVSLSFVSIAVLVSVSTALVGPVTFFGLLVANLSYLLLSSNRHLFTLPTAVLLGVISLLGGQLLLERVFEFNASIRVIIEFLGGILFIILMLRGSTK